MALVVKDRVKQTTTTTGTGSVVLNGTVSGFQTFAAALSNGDTTYYAIFEPSTNEYEVGLGTWTESTATLARTTILESSNSGSAVSLTAQAEVFITQPAEKAVYLDASNNVTLTNDLTVSGDFTVSGTTTTIDTTNSVVTDSLIELSNGTTGTPANDAGIVIERGDSDNAFIGYDESADKFTVGTGSFTGASTGNLTISTGTLVANVEGNLTGNVTGNVSGSSGSTTGNAATATALQTARTIAGQSFDGTANITIAPTDLTGVTSTAAELNILDGVTSTTAELNLLDGVTATTTELNYVDGVTSAIQTQLDAKAPINNPTFTGSISHAGDLTIDVGGYLNLDADNAGGIFLKDGGTTYGQFNTSSNSFVVKSVISDGDLIFKGNDGGSEITALTLDMSNSGNAVFNNHVYLADNGKAIFGAGSDLQIYHDGSHSYISDQGTGNLRILAGEFNVKSASGNTDLIYGVNGGAVTLYNNGNAKIATTSTGIDVTGTVTADSLTVDTNTLHVDATNNRVGIGTTSPERPLHISANPPIILLEDTGGGTDDKRGQINVDTGLFQISARNDDNSNRTDILTADLGTGHVGLGTTSPATPLNIEAAGSSSAGENTHVRINDTTNMAAGVGGVIQLSGEAASGSSTQYNFATIKGIKENGTTGNYDGALTFATRANGVSPATEHMRITSDGDVGIGTTSPSRNLYISGGSSSRVDVQLSYDALGTTSNDGVQLGIQSGGGYIWNFENSSLYFATNNTERMRIDSSGKVGIGTSSPDVALRIQRTSTDTYSSSSSSAAVPYTANDPATTIVNASLTNSSASYLGLLSVNSNGLTNISYIANISKSGSGQYSGDLVFGSRTGQTAYAERMRIDSDGSLLHGTTNASIGSSSTENGIVLNATGTIAATRGGNIAAVFNRRTDDGAIVHFRKDGSTVGSIGTGAVGGTLYIEGDSVGSGLQFGNANIYPRDAGALSDNGIDLGQSSYRFKDLYLSGSLSDGTTSRTVADIVGLPASRLGPSYEIPNTGNSASWVKLGNFAAAQTGISCLINVVTNSGYNADDTQNAQLEIRFKTSNNSSNQSGVYADVQAYRTGTNAYPSIVRVVQVSTTSFDIWCYFGTYTGDGSFYTVNQTDGTWTHSGSTGTPSGTSIDATINTMWHSGNDGSGSTLDADLLDGVEGSSYLRSDAADSASNTITISTGTNPALVAASDDWGEQLEIKRTNSSVNWPSIKFSNDAGEHGRVFVDVSNDYLMYVKAGGSNYETVWTNYTDGSGSGLDADQLDNIQGNRMVYGDNASGSNPTSATQNVYELAQYKSGFWEGYNGSWLPSTGTWWWGATFAHRSNSSSYNYSGQLAFLNGGGGDNIYARTISNGSPTSWSRLWTSGNATGAGYVDIATGDYGTIKVDDDRGNGWAGYAIQDDWVFMGRTGDCGIYNDTDNEWAIYITQNGSVQLRYNGGYALETTSGGVAVTGALTATGDITAYYSDERLKNFEGKIDGALDKVSKLSGYYYRENDKAKELGYENDARQVGVSAQEVEAVMPEVVKPAPVDPEYKTVQYEKLVPLLIEAIKELKEEVRQLKEDKA